MRESRALQKGQVIRYEGRDLLVDIRGRRGPHPGVSVEVVTDKRGVMRVCYQDTSLPFRDVSESRPQRHEAAKKATEEAQKRDQLLRRLGRAGLNPARARGLSNIEIEALIPPQARAAGAHPWRNTGSP